jgi:hypothetical protein
MLVVRRRQEHENFPSVLPKLLRRAFTGLVSARIRTRRG